MICGANSCVWVLMYKIMLVHKTHNPAAIGVALPSLLDHLPVCIGQAEIKLFLHNDPVDNQGLLQEFVFQPGQMCIRVQLHFDTGRTLTTRVILPPARVKRGLQVAAFDTFSASSGSSSSYISQELQNR